MERRKIYLAGPDVFRPDARDVGRRKKELCAAYGFEGLFPLDGEIALDGLSPREAGMAIYRANVDLIESADGCLADMTPFRGPSLDAGTAYEIGHMRGLGKPVFAYSRADARFAERTRRFCGVSGARDGEGLEIEDFGLWDNLMIDGAVAAAGAPVAAGKDEERAFEACLAAAAAYFSG